MHGPAATLNSTVLGRFMGFLMVFMISLAYDGHWARADSSSDAALVDRALDFAGRDQWNRAEAIIENAEDEELIQFIRWKRLLDRDGGLPFEDFVSFLGNARDWPFETTIRLRAEAALRPSTDIPARLQFFEEIKPKTADGRRSYAEALLATGKTARGRDMVRQSWRNDDFGGLRERRFLRDFADYLTPEDHQERLERLLWEGKHVAASRMLSLVSSDLRHLAEARMRLRQRARGVDAAIARVPDDLIDHPGLVYERARWRRLKNRPSAAAELLEDPLESPNGAKAIWRERQWHIWDRIGERDYHSAYRYAANHTQSDILNFAEAEWLAGWLALRFLDNPEDAVEHFERLYNKVGAPISLARGAYWRGRAALALDQPLEATTWFEKASHHPATFYGQLAIAELGHPFALEQPSLDAVLLSSEAPVRFPKARPTPSPVLELAHRLCRLGATREIDAFAGYHLKRSANRQIALKDLADLARSCGRPDVLVRHVRINAGTLGLDPVSSFPVPDFPPLLATRDGLDPALALAVARQESLFDPEALSHAGARGMMQLMPATGRAVARQVGEELSGDRLRYDPALNVKLGRRYLLDMLDRFDGNTALAVAAYNAGPHRVSGWLQRMGPIEGDDRYGWIDWIERIPFAETRNYVQRVLEGQTVYRARLERPSDDHLIPFATAPGPLIPTPNPINRPSQSS